MWMSGGGPYLVERAEGGVDVGTQRRGMAQRRDAADHLAGRRTYEVGIGPFERWQVLLGADLLYVDAMGTGSQDEDRFAFGIEMRLLAIAPTSMPRAVAASCAVRAESGSIRMSPVAPRALSAFATVSTRGCNVMF